MTNRLIPLTEPYPESVAEALNNYPQQDGYILQLFRTFANSVRFLKKAVPNLLDRGSPLPLRVREIVILRVTANKNCEYEWGVHVSIFADAAKLTPEQIAATWNEDTETPVWSRQERSLIAAIDQLCMTGSMDDEALDVFQNDWSLEQQLEIFALCGTYHTISFVANVARLDNEPFGARFPS